MTQHALKASRHLAEKRLTIGTAVSVFPRLFPARDWSEEALRIRETVPLRGGEAPAVVVAVHDSHGLCYDVRFANGIIASYDPDEVEPAAIPLAVAVRFDSRKLWVDLKDGRTVGVPLDWFVRLQCAKHEQLSDWRLVGEGEGIHWPQLDEDLSIAGLLRGRWSR